MTKIRSILTLMAALFILMTSVEAQRAKQVAARDYFPLRVGDSWKYRMTEGDTEYTVKVLSAEKQADGTTLYLLEKQAGVVIRDWYSKTNGWVLMHREAYAGQEGLDIKYEPPKQYLKNPLVAGEKWNWKGKSITQTDVEEHNEVIGIEVVKVPAGTFRAMKIVSRGSNGEAIIQKTYWYADGVGLVKSTSEGGQLKNGWELVDYSFKKTGAKR